MLSRARQQGIGNALLGAIGAWLVGATVAIAAVIDPMQSFMLPGIGAAGIDVSLVRTVSSEEAADALPDAGQIASVRRRWAIHLSAMPAPHQRSLLSAVASDASLKTIDVGPMSQSVTPTTKVIYELATASDAMLIGQPVAQARWPRQSPHEVLRLLAKHGAPTAVIRLGSGAALGISNGTVVWMPGLADLEQGMTPAADAYGGAFAAAYARRPHLPEAMAWAGAAAAAVAKTRIPLELANPYARRWVDASAALLLAKSLQQD